MNVLPWKKLWPALVVAPLLLGVLLYFLHEHLRRDALEQLTFRHHLLTTQTAHRMEDNLRRLAGELNSLAYYVREWPSDRLAAAAGLAHLHGEHAAMGLAAVFLIDENGNLLAAYPSEAAIADAFPLHLLESARPSPARPHFTPLTGRGFLYLSQPVEKEGSILHLGALLSLEQWIDFCLHPLAEAADFYFLLDDRGHFQWHRDGELTGQDCKKTLFPHGLLQYSRFLTDLHQGKYGTANSPQPMEVLYRRPDAPAAAQAVLMSGAPVRVESANWSLALTWPKSALSSPLGGRRNLFIGSLLVLSAALALAAGRWPHYSRRQAVAQESGRLANDSLRAALDLAQQRYRYLLDHSGEAIFFIDPATGALQEVNRQAEQLLGYRAEEIRTLSLAVLFPGRHHRRFLRLVNRVLRHGQGEEGGLLFRRKDGQTFIGAVHARLGKLGEDRIVHGVLRDVTSVNRIEQELRQKNRDLLLLNDIADQAAASRGVEEMLDPILDKIVAAYGADGGGIFLMAEEGRLQLTAHQGIEEEIRREIATFLPGQGMIGRVAASGQAKTSADLRRDQRVSSSAVRRAEWGGFHAVPLTANDRTVGVLFLFYREPRVLGSGESNLLRSIGKQAGTAVEGRQLFDALQRQVRLTRVTNRELEQSRQQLRESLASMEESNRALAQLDRMKSNFLALASHELRTPLTYILSGTELLAVQLNDRLLADEGRLLEAIQQGGKRLQEIVDDLLEMARLESKSLYLARERIDLPPLLDAVAAEFRPVLAERRLALRMNTASATLPLHGDAHHLQRTFHRLLENAVKFTPEGGWIEIRTAVRSAEEIRRQEELLRSFSPGFFATTFPERLLQISICDSGVGIDPENQVRIFEKFYEVGDITGHSTSRTRFGGKGVGLGLTLVKGMIEAHDGMVWVESSGTGDGGEGSVFHLLLPLAANTEEINRAQG